VVDVVFVPGGFRFSAHVDAAVEWALRENGHTVRRLCRDCLHVIGQGALTNLQADVLLTVHGRRFPHPLLRDVNYPTVVWLVDEPQEVEFSQAYGRHFDIVLTNDANTCGIHGPHKCWYLPLAADPRWRALPAAAGREVVDVTFVGGIVPERVALLSRVYALTAELSWRIVGAGRHCPEVSFAEVWERRSIPHAEGVVLSRSSRIVLDLPRDETVSFAGRTNRRGIPAMGVNNRPFEVPVTGSFLLTSDARRDIFRLYPNGEVGIFRHNDAADLAQQIRYYLDHDDEREGMAQAAYDTCMAKHTYPVRVKQLMDIVEQWQATRMPPGKPAKKPRKGKEK
jgi:spore maturation protein CgeB